MSNYDYSLLKTILDRLLAKDLSIITPENTKFINDIAMQFYQTNYLKFTQSDIAGLKNLILICNLLYNRTNMRVLPIEDGFYDLLLELYKKFDPNFQVGSYLVEFDEIDDGTVDSKQKEIICPIEFFEPRERDDLKQAIYDKIILKDESVLNTRDLYTCPIEFDAPYIQKRLHNVEHNHPMLVGTLDKAKFVLNQDAINAGVFDDPNVVVLERDFFQDHINKGIYSRDTELHIVCELKYDGISVEADCNFTLQSARSRGDTGIGVASDMTPILKDYPFKQAACMIGEEPLGVKFEAIMTKSDLYRFNIARNKNYANCRTAIVGLFGASDAYLYRDYITLVPLALDLDQFNQNYPNTPITDRLSEIAFINNIFVSNGEPLRYCVFSGTVSELLYLIKAFTDEAKYARDYLNFMYDGIVVNILNNDIREKLGRKNFVNKFSMAVKFDPLEKQTTFRGYTYEVGQHGDITPMIHYDPIEFNGTIHTKSSGASLKRFRDLSLKIGDIINVTYVNDVMPYVSKLDCKQNRENPNSIVQFPIQCPVCGSNLMESDSGKSAYCPNRDCPARSIQRMTNMFAKMNIKGFAEATFTALNKSNLRDLCIMNREELISILGEADGAKMYEVLQSLLTKPQKDYIIMGALGFTSIARKKWEDILKHVTLRDLHDTYQNLLDTGSTMEEIFTKFLYYLASKIPNLGEITGVTIIKEFPYFFADIKFIVNNMIIENSFGRDDSGKIQVRFTGFRNSQLVEQLITAGYDAGDGSITKNTNILLIPYNGFTSSKVTKAQKIPNIMIMTETEFRERFNIP